MAGETAPTQTSTNTGSGAAYAGTLVQAGALMTGGISSLIGAMKESPESRSARHIWQRSMPAANRLMSSLYYMPWMQGQRIHYSGDQYQWAPSQSLRNVYSSYLNRGYGLSDAVSNALSAQAVSPLGTPQGQMRGSMTPLQLGALTQRTPQQFAQAALGTQVPEYLTQRDYLQGAAQLSGFNQWRAQKMQELVG